jgi:hypothetical protein
MTQRQRYKKSAPKDRCAAAVGTEEFLLNFLQFSSEVYERNPTRAFDAGKRFANNPQRYFDII